MLALLCVTDDGSSVVHSVPGRARAPVLADAAGRLPTAAPFRFCRKATTRGESRVMHTFDTSAPVHAVLDIGLGDAWVIADARDRTRVAVHPGDPDDPRGAATAERTRVEFAEDRLLVMTPRPSGSGWTGGAVTVVVELPAGSSLHARGSVADFRCEGRLGKCRLTSGYGHISLDRADVLSATTDFGDIDVGETSGDVKVVAHSGDLRVRRIGGRAVVCKPEGRVRIGEIAGALRLRGADGPVRIGRAHCRVDARTAAGDIRVAEALRGPLELESVSGEIEVGLPGATAPRMEASSGAGTVYRSLDTFAPEAGAQAVTVRAHSVTGDILVRRSHSPEQL